jgi:hypothetical protein
MSKVDEMMELVANVETLIANVCNSINSGTPRDTDKLLKALYAAKAELRAKLEELEKQVKVEKDKHDYSLGYLEECIDELLDSSLALTDKTDVEQMKHYIVNHFEKQKDK